MLHVPEGRAVVVVRPVMIGCLCCHDRSPTVGYMTTTVSRSLADCAQRVVKRDPLAELDESIAFYARQTDEASEWEVRRLRRIRHGMICPNGRNPIVCSSSLTQP